MNDRGYICLSRGALEHEFFRRKEFSEFEAWVWLLAEAEWKPRLRRAAEFLVPLERGELLASIRHMGRTWKWSPGKVERFLERLKNESMIVTKVDTGITVITICNYDKYQTGPTKTDTPVDTATDQGQVQDRDTDGHNIETLKQLNNKTVEGATAPTAEKKSRKKPVRPMPDIFPMSEAQKAYAEKRGYKFEIPPCFAFNRTRAGPAQVMFEAFKNHHAAKGSAFADWDAAWRTWVDNQARWDTERGKPPGLRPAI